DRSNYRRFRIKTVEGQDDFASVAEVVRRRYTRVLAESQTRIEKATEDQSNTECKSQSEDTLSPGVSDSERRNRATAAEHGEAVTAELQRMADDVGAAVKGRALRSVNT